MTNHPLANLSVLQLKRAVAIREQMQTLQKELNQIADGHSAPEQNSAAPKKKRKMSAEARAKHSASMKARWAKFRVEKAKAAKATK